MKQVLAQDTERRHNHRMPSQSEHASQEHSAFVDHRASTAQLQEMQTVMTNAPHAVAQRKRSEQFHNSARMTTQRRQMAAITGVPLQKIADEEELNQGQYESEPVQRVEDEEELIQGNFEAIQRAEVSTKKPNNTGLPDDLKSGIEYLSGMSMDTVNVHFNSDKPAQLNAHAYAQGTDIHLAPGQEKHLPHEAWHVVQQAQGRVRPTMQMKDGVPVNDDSGLEQEADNMGRKALNTGVVQSVMKGIKQDSDAFDISAASMQGAKNTWVFQRSVASDLNDAQQNFAYIVTETGNINTAAGNVVGAINNAAIGADQTNAAAGLLDYTYKFVDQIEGKKAEIYEAERLAGKAVKSRLPILSGNDKVDPDIRYHNASGDLIVKEVKAVSSANTGTVTQRIKEADGQLGGRHGDKCKILIRIENPNNPWPGVQAQGRMHNDNDLRREVKNALPYLANADEIRIEGITVNYGGGGQKNLTGEVTGTGVVPMARMIVF